MARIAYFDAFSGISGDMAVGALLDAGAPAEPVFTALASLPIEARCTVEKVHRAGISASKFRVHVDAPPSSHRHLGHILNMLDRSSLPVRAKANATAIFQKLGEAEAAVHGVALDQVHFHEVGAVDSIADIAGACVALDLLGVGEVFCSPVNTGSGTVQTEHGVLPVPAPATARLLTGQPIYARGPEMELTTPTGAAIVATLARGFGALPALRIAATGFGAGDRDFKHHANVLRVLIGERSEAPESTVVSVIEANIDDSSPQVLGHALERLMGEGALDASLSPLLMKKSRPGSLLRVIAKPEDQERLVQTVFAETSTLGLRIHTAERRVEERRVVTVETPWGQVRVKVSSQGAYAPEYDDCRLLAASAGVPLPRVFAAAHAAMASGNYWPK